jgi:integrase
MKPLTDKEIRAAKPRVGKNGSPIKYDLVDSTRDRGVGRLILRVSEVGTKKFSFRFKYDQKTLFVQLGQYPSMSLAVARDAIKPLQKYLLAGKNPKVELIKQKVISTRLDVEESKTGTIKELFEGYTNKMRLDGKSTHETVLRALEKEIYPIIDKASKAKLVPVDEFVGVLSVMIDRGAEVQSNRVRSYLHAAFNYGLKQDKDPKDKSKNIKFGLSTNPISGIPKQSAAEVAGTNYLNVSDIAKLIRNFYSTKGVGVATSLLLKLCFFTGGQRPHELARAEWEKIDWDEATLGLKTKNKKPHLVPLGPLAIDLLSYLANHKADSQYIFPHRLDKSKHMLFTAISKAVVRYRQQNPNFPIFIPRDIRRSCKTNMRALGIPKVDLDKLNNHAAPDVSSKHYDMYENLKEKRAAIDIWDGALTDELNKLKCR